MLWFALLLLVGSTCSTKWKYENYELPTNTIEQHVFGIFDLKDAPFGSRRPFGRVELDFVENESPLRPATVWTYLVSSTASEFIGDELDGSNYLCCWQEVYDKGLCDNLGEPIIQDEMQAYENTEFFSWQVGWKQFIPGVNLTGDNESIPSNSSSLYPVNLNLTEVQWDLKTGLWIFAILNCGANDTSDNEDFHMSGLVHFRNPYGELPGDILGLMPVYLFCAAAYLCAHLWWVIASFLISKEKMLFLQKAILVVMWAGFIENTLYFSDYMTYNYRGEISLAFNVLSVLALTFKRTSAFMCLIMICSGYTIIYAKMSKKYIVGLTITGIVYVVICLIYEFIKMLRYTPATQYLRVPDSAEDIMLAAMSIVDFCVLLWIFISLFKSVGILSKQKKHPEKHKRFSLLLKIIGVAYLVSFVFLGIQAYASMADKYAAWWKGWWVWDAYWSMLYVFLVIIIAWLWRPNGNNRKLQYEEFEDEENIELPETDASDVKVTIRTDESSEGEIPRTSPKTSPKEPERKSNSPKPNPFDENDTNEDEEEEESLEEKVEKQQRRERRRQERREKRNK